MPNYTFNHIHHETKNVDEAVTWYIKLFNATSDEPFERSGATWVPVHIGTTQITVTAREFTDVDLGRYQGYDHFALNTDDFNQSLADIEAQGVEIWMGPIALENGMRIVFINGPDQVKIELMELQ